MTTSTERYMTAYVYIMANATRTLYTGVTSDLHRRVWEHRFHDDPGSFTAKYRLHKLVFFTEFASIADAIAFEKYVKGKKRAWKMGLVEQQNPRWNDLAWDWFREECAPDPGGIRRSTKETSP